MGKGISKTEQPCTLHGSHSLSGDNKWICNDCGKDCFIDEKDYYMVRFDIWKSHGVGDGMLCMDCMEDRLGHKLQKEDIHECPITLSFNPYTSAILSCG